MTGAFDHSKHVIRGVETRFVRIRNPSKHATIKVGDQRIPRNLALLEGDREGDRWWWRWWCRCGLNDVIHIIGEVRTAIAHRAKIEDQHDFLVRVGSVGSRQIIGQLNPLISDCDVARLFKCDAAVGLVLDFEQKFGTRAWRPDFQFEFRGRIQIDVGCHREPRSTPWLTRILHHFKHVIACVDSGFGWIFHTGEFATVKIGDNAGPIDACIFSCDREGRTRWSGCAGTKGHIIPVVGLLACNCTRHSKVEKDGREVVAIGQIQRRRAGGLVGEIKHKSLPAACDRGRGFGFDTDLGYSGLFDFQTNFDASIWRPNSYRHFRRGQGERKPRSETDDATDRGTSPQFSASRFHRANHLVLGVRWICDDAGCVTTEIGQTVIRGRSIERHGQRQLRVGHLPK